MVVMVLQPSQPPRASSRHSATARWVIGHAVVTIATVENPGIYVTITRKDRITLTMLDGLCPYIWRRSVMLFVSFSGVWWRFGLPLVEAEEDKEHIFRLCN